jgi:hypothetical protein
MSLRVRVILLAIGVLAAGAVVYVLAFSGRSLPRPRYVAKTAAPSTFTLATVEGDVEVKRGDSWVRVQPGDTLSAAEAIRTADGSSALIRDERGDELTLRERVELGVNALSQTVTELTLRRGKVKAAPGASTERFDIHAASADAVAPAGSRFTVYADERGAVAVASEKGDVKVIAAGKTVTVPARTRTTVEPGAGPSDPVAVSDDVFLSVAWPAGEVHATHVAVGGKTEPGAIVTVNGKPAAVGPDGVFTADVPLVDGKNPIEVATESIDGSHKKDDHAVDVRTKVPLDADPSHLYDPPKKKTP